MADRVDAPVHGMQPTALQPVLDRPRPDSQFEELRPRHDAVLLGGESSDAQIPLAARTSGHFSPDSGDE